MSHLRHQTGIPTGQGQTQACHSADAKKHLRKRKRKESARDRVALELRLEDEAERT